MKYLFVRPDVPAPETWVPLLQEAYERRYFTNFGGLEQKLTAAMEAAYGCAGERAVLCTNATAALTAALIALGVKGRVLVPAFTFPATLTAVLAARCEPVLCDVDAATGEMDVASARAALEAYPCAAVMPVRAYGFVRDLSGVIELAREKGAKVVVDAAAALGAPRAPFGEDVVEVFSLHATKSFGIGEGGIAFAAPDVAGAIKRAINFDLQPDRTFGFGINAKMTEVQASIGLALLPQMAGLLEGRAAMAARYRAFLARIPRIRVLAPAQAEVWTNFPILLPEEVDCAALEAAACGAGLQVRRYYFPSLAEGYRGELAGAVPTPNAARLSRSAICLPLYSRVTDGEFAEICGIFTDALAACGLRS